MASTYRMAPDSICYLPSSVVPTTNNTLGNPMPVDDAAYIGIAAHKALH